MRKERKDEDGRVESEASTAIYGVDSPSWSQDWLYTFWRSSRIG